MREGPLPGSGQWTHQYADPANTGVSQESLVRAPLGLLWFGGPSNRNVFNRHGRAPIPQVAGGRVIILGPDKLQARDVYTGQKMWIREIPGIGEYYQGGFRPGADQVGSPYVSLEDRIYIADRDTILILDPETGKDIDHISSDSLSGVSKSPDWGLAEKRTIAYTQRSTAPLQGAKIRVNHHPRVKTRGYRTLPRSGQGLCLRPSGARLGSPWF